jgi:hypothetical protein
MNTVFALIAIIGGAIFSLIAWRVVALDKWVSAGEMEAWHEKYGKIVKILGPVAVVAGFLFLILG